MVTKVVMPKLGEFMTEGTVVKWLRKEGETVEKGEELVEVEGEKAVYALEAPVSGVLRKIIVPEGSVIPVNETIAIIAGPSEELPEIVRRDEKEAIEPKELGEVIERIEASPAAKRLAREFDVELKKVKGTGPGGVILKEDVERFIEELQPIRRVRETIPLTGVKKIVAERMSQSFRTAPHTTVIMEVDMSEAVKLREELRSDKDIHVSYTVLLVKAAANALEKNPILNSTLKGDQIKIFDDINIGVAVETERGLVVPVIHNANKKSIKELAITLDSLVEKARKDTLSGEEMTGGTFTISNLGMFGVNVFVPIINPPESAILGVGKIDSKFFMVDKEMVMKPVMYLSLTFDHRVLDGVQAAKFLQSLKEIIENPQKLKA